ncbi:MAG: Holliday junction branch migration protein RuvA [Terriglobales bacterium]
MIAFLRGVLLERTPNRAVVDVHGVGYELLIPLSTFQLLPAAGAEVRLHVHTQLREDALQLFGFATAREKAIFEHLLGVSGVGPKMALAALSGLAVNELAAAIAASDVARLTAVPGIGKKTAERICVELRDKLAEWAAPAVAATALPAAAEEVLSALVNLGYARPLAEKAVRRAAERQPAPAGFEELFKRSLQVIG